jgi:hypothetical protein
MKIYSPTITGSIANTNIVTTTRITSLSALSSSFASTASYANSFTVGGTLTAQTINVQTITSSIEFVTGSTRNGSLAANTHQFTGSVLMTGSLTVTTTGTELQVNAGGVNIGNALTDNHIISGSVMINPNGLFVSSSGVVGIGTTSPAVALQVVGAGRFSGNINGTGEGTYMGLDAAVVPRLGFVKISGAQPFLGFAADPFTIKISNSTTIATSNTFATALSITTAGNVGIGASTTPVYKLEVSTAGGSERIRVGTLQNNNNTATFEAITSAGISTATSGWIRAVYGGGLALGTSTYTKTGGDSGNFANLSAESATTAMTINGGDVQLSTTSTMYNTSAIISIPNSATTIFSSTGYGGVWLVTYAVSGNPSQVGYAIVGNSFGSTLNVLASTAGSQTSLSVSGLNLQLSQSAGGSINTRINVIRLNTTLG